MNKSAALKKRWFISREDLEAWLDGIASARTLIAPHQVAGITLYGSISKSNEITWSGPQTDSGNYNRPIMSIKEIFLPPTERLFTIQKSKQEIHLEEYSSDQDIVVFGVRPCDARGVKLLDAIFIDTNPVDSAYARRRKNTTLIGLACKDMGTTCFCTSVGGAPDDSRDMDVMLHETDGGFLVSAITEKGRFIIPAGEWKETTAEPPQLSYKAKFKVLENSEWPKHFHDEYWMSTSERCLSCRACAYVCPTCRCFIVRDEVINPEEFERIRCWDSCTGANYRRVAGGHRPRAEKGERLRNRFYCKFYAFSEQYELGNVSACTGCGRCIDVCPVGVDITEVLMDMENSQ
jgi:sulfhydrogenase subunit beta (sulfur reductase)